jgi:hypothetical protein
MALIHGLPRLLTSSNGSAFRASVLDRELCESTAFRGPDRFGDGRFWIAWIERDEGCCARTTSGQVTGTARDI